MFANRILTLIFLSQSFAALAELPRRQYDHHLGGIWDNHSNSYVPDIGTATNFGFRPRALPTPVPVPQLPEGTTEVFNVYSRGNDDVDETDEAGVSNFETARVRVSAFTTPRPGGGFSLGIRYVATLKTDEAQSLGIGARVRLACGESNLDNQFLPQPATLVPALSGRATVMDATLTQQLSLGVMSGNRTYVGECQLVMPSGATRQVMRWTATVANGQVVGLTTSLAERDAQGGRRGDQLLRLVESNERPAPTLAQPFPTRRGSTSGPAVVGGR